MALALSRVRLQDLAFVITGGGTVTAIRDLKFNATQGTFSVNAADSTYEQKVLGRKNLTGSYSMWLGTGGVAPAIGATLSAITANVSSDTTVPTTFTDGTTYGTIKVTGVSQTYSDPAGVVEVTFEAGFIT